MKGLSKVINPLATISIFVLMQVLLGLAASGSPGQLISKPNSDVSPAITGGGDSYLPIISPDGRFVLFASTARNLTQIGTNGPAPPRFPARLNVFLEDRTNSSTILISVNVAATGGGNGDSLPSGISTDGRYALFESTASDLVAGDTNNARDVFVRDVLTGKTLLVSTGITGGFADKPAYSSVMTPDSRYVSFASAAANLISGDTNGIADVFVRDMVSNVTTLVSVGAQTTPALGSQLGSDAPLITPDGRYVAFQSSALKLATGTSNFANIYIRDLVDQTTTLASSGALPALQSIGKASNAVSFSHALSSDGRYVAFQTTPYPLSFVAPNLVLRNDARTGNTDLIDTNGVPAPGGLYTDSQNLGMTPDGRFVTYVARANGTLDTSSAVRLWDAQTAVDVLVSHDLTNGVAPGSVSDSPVLDDTGRFVAFVSSATDLVTNDLKAGFHLYLADAENRTISLVDEDTKGLRSGVESDLTPLLLSDPIKVAFYSQQDGLVALDSNRGYDVFFHDVPSGANELISRRDPGLPSVAANGTVALTRQSLSWDGRMAVFSSDASDLVGHDTNGLPDVFVRDLAAGTNYLISINTNGASADGLSSEAVISADGQTVAFASFADDLVGGDTNQAKDVFVSTLAFGQPVLASVNYASTGSGNRDSYSPVLSTKGQFLLFHSRAGNLTPGMVAGRDNLFWRDLKANQTYALTTNGVASSSMTADGRQVAFVTASSFGGSSPVSDRLYVWDAQAPGTVLSLAGSGSAFSVVALSSDGQRMAYVTNVNGLGQIWAIDRTLGANWQVGTFQAATEPGLRFSADGRLLTYAAYSSQSPLRQIYLYDSQTGTNVLISQAYDGSGPADGHSDSAEISSDGRFISYHSEADNLVPGDTNGLPDLFLFDRLTGSTTLVWANLDGNHSANGSFSSVFSGDARSVVFASWASDLVAGDFNNASDLFLMNLVSSAEITPFAVTISPASPPSGGNWLVWTVLPGKTYTILFKNDLSDPVWQQLDAPISVVGDRATATDGSVSAAARFYRIVAY